MSSAYPVPRAAFLAASVSQESALAIREAAERNAVIAELEKNATMEIAGIGDHAVKTAAAFTRGADSTRRLLSASGYESANFDDAQTDIVKTTTENMSKMAVYGQIEVIRIATADMLLQSTG